MGGVGLGGVGEWLAVMEGSGRRLVRVCAVECDGGEGFVLSGSRRSICLVLSDALFDGVGRVFVLEASGRPLWLRVRDSLGRPVGWRVREVEW